VIEQYRRLGAAAHHAQEERGIRVLMIVSALEDEGKTLTAVNLGLTLSESYQRRVLLVDADLRRPALHDLLGVPNTVGWREALEGTADQARSWTRLAPTLSVLTAGEHTDDPIPALTSGRLPHVLRRAAAEFDWVVLDTPPVAMLPDANLLAGHVDAAVLVVRAGVTPLPMIRRAIDAVGRERILGVALNRVDRNAMGRAYYRYGAERTRA
jgi:capsular exopolysaccharide synthesis family protein